MNEQLLTFQRGALSLSIIAEGTLQAPAATVFAQQEPSQ